MRLGTLLLLVAAASGAAACASALDFDRFQVEALAPTSTDTVYELDAVFTDMLPHIDQYFELRLIDKENALQGKVVFDRVLNKDFSFVLPSFVPALNGPYRLDFWSDQSGADETGSNTYSPVGGSVATKDHGWRRKLQDPTDPEPLPRGSTVVAFDPDQQKFRLSFVHDTIFQDLFRDLNGSPSTFADEESLLAFAPTILVPAGYLGQTVEVRVERVKSASRQLVGVHRKGKAEASYKPTLTGILDLATPYLVSIYVDANGDGAYTTGEPGWRFEKTSMDGGVVDVIDLATTPQTDLAVAPQP